MKLKGKAWKVGDHIDTDVIIPAPYLNITDPSRLAEGLFEPIRKNFSKMVKEGDILLAGKNFGCGSSREHAPLAIKASGISCVIAKSFARIFYRNSFNIGLPLIISTSAVDNSDEGDMLEVDLEGGKIRNITKNLEFSFSPFEKFLLEISSEGLINYILKRKDEL
jgi:3-isopropylmalate/(R)-2-methylmalate dehydratase small subunit